MKLKNICFVLIPLIFFGCGAYHYLSKSEEHLDVKKVPENKRELQKQVEKFHGRKK